MNGRENIRVKHKGKDIALKNVTLGTQCGHTYVLNLGCTEFLK